MAGTIEHQWNGSVLTITSDIGTSSADLKGPKGDTGPRGPQGPAGVIYNDEGELVVDLSPFALKAEIDALDAETAQEFERVDSALQTKASLEQVNQAVQRIDLSNYATKDEVEEAVKDVDLTNYATHNYVSTEIAKAQLEGAGVDTSGFATKDDLAAIEVDIDGTTIVKDNDGNLKTAIGGYKTGYYATSTGSSLTLEVDQVVAADDALCFEIMFEDGSVETFVVKCGSALDGKVNFLYSTTIISSSNAVYCEGIYVTVTTSGKQRFSTNGVSTAEEPAVTGMTLTLGYAPGGQYIPIDANFIPVDGSTIQIIDGKLVAIGGASLPSSEGVEY